MTFHHKAVEADIASIKADWASRQWVKAGGVAADLLALVLGPVESTIFLA